LRHVENPGVDMIVRAVAGRFGVRPEEILSARKTKVVARARAIAIFIARKVYDFSTPELGMYFGRYHTTVADALIFADSMVHADPELGVFVAEVVESVKTLPKVFVESTKAVRDEEQLKRELAELPPHRCHAADCNVTVPPKLLFCLRHWKMLDISKQRLVWFTYRKGQEVDKRPSKAYLAASSLAISYVANQEGKELAARFYFEKAQTIMEDLKKEKA